MCENWESLFRCPRCDTWTKVRDQDILCDEARAKKVMPGECSAGMTSRYKLARVDSEVGPFKDGRCLQCLGEIAAGAQDLPEGYSRVKEVLDDEGPK